MTENKKNSLWRRVPPILVPSILLVCFRVSCRPPQAIALRGSFYEDRVDESFAQTRVLSLKESPTATKPKIYTFVSGAPSTLQTQAETPGLNENVDDNDQDWMTAWDQAWSESGWEPVILDANHAKQHEEFENMNQSMDELDFDYDDRRYVWQMLAMSQAGGGWLVDHRTFPLHEFSQELPHNGRLTVHTSSSHREEQKGSSDLILFPHLVSGSAQEWFRAATVRMKKAEKRDANTDNLYEIVPNAVSTRGSDVETCDTTRGKYAIHFGKDQSNSLARQASQWLDRWRTNCR